MQTRALMDLWKVLVQPFGRLRGVVVLALGELVAPETKRSSPGKYWQAAAID
jgi:hypothetical protein